jgi:serine/threonine-protein kinase
MDRTSSPGVPRTVGKYQIVALLSKGSTSTVYLGRDPSTLAEVAIKFGDAASANDVVLLERFDRQFRIVSRLRHPNLVHVVELAWHDGRPCVVMEYVDGENLAKRIARTDRLGQAEAIDYFGQVAQALHAAHAEGIFHLDVNPDNILLAWNGPAKLTGLGIGNDGERKSRLSRPSRANLTANFVAPELFGDAMQASVRSDVYSLAATLFVALTGQVPFAAPSLSGVLKRKLASESTSPRRLVPSLSPRVDWEVRRALMADPEQRHVSCLEFVASLMGETRCAGSTTAGTGSLSGGTKAKPVRPEGEERRAAARFECTVPIPCTVRRASCGEIAAQPSCSDGQVRDLSSNGIGLLLSRAIEPGSLLTVNLDTGNGQVKTTRDVLVMRVTSLEGRRWFVGGKLTKGLSKEELRLLLQAGGRSREPETISPAPTDTSRTAQCEPANSHSGLPTFFGPYEAVESIGSGATATVYKGRDPQTGQVVALKVCHGFMELEHTALERFKREFTAISRLEHPHLVRALATGEDRTRGITYVAMEYVPGQNLEQRLAARGPSTPEETIRIFLQVAEALRYLHANNLVHRDVKPGNILLDELDGAKLADFGLLKDLTVELRLTPTGSAMGTVEFGAPEQFEDASRVDRRCDLFSLAASLYTALTGKFPFGNGSQLQIIQRKVHNQFVPLRLLLPALDPEIDRLVNRCLEPCPDRRPDTCDELISVLQDCASRPSRGAGDSTETEPHAMKLRRSADRRASVRFAVDLTASLVPFHQKMRGRWDATILDISATGVRLEFPRDVAVNSVLEINLAGRVNSELALVRWVEPGGGQKRFVGCSFVRPLPERELEILCRAGAPLDPAER